MNFATNEKRLTEITQSPNNLERFERLSPILSYYQNMLKFELEINVNLSDSGTMCLQPVLYFIISVNAPYHLPKLMRYNNTIKDR